MLNCIQCGRKMEKQQTNVGLKQVCPICKIEFFTMKYRGKKKNVLNDNSNKKR